MEVQLLKVSKPENKTIQFCGYCKRYTEHIKNICQKCNKTIQFCGYCKRYTEHIKNICQKCGSDNTKIQGFNPNLM